MRGPDILARSMSVPQRFGTTHRRPRAGWPLLLREDEDEEVAVEYSWSAERSKPG
jgi:hypothetical protein